MDQQNKKCPKCKIIKNVYYFYKHSGRKDGLDLVCKNCKNQYGGVRKNRKKICKSCNIDLNETNWYGPSNGYECTPCHKIRINNNHRKNKELIINKYGGKCKLCGICEIDFLTIDHINQDGNAHRKEIGSAGIYRWLIKNNFPKDNFRLLCWNCNSGRQNNHPEPIAKFTNHSSLKIKICTDCGITLSINNRTAYDKNKNICIDCACIRLKYDSQIFRRNLKLKILNHYGNSCACCGETNPNALNLHHINNDGAFMRKKYGHSSGKDFYKWLLKRNFEYESPLQVLCFNCNCSIEYCSDGICPHKKNNKP